MSASVLTYLQKSNYFKNDFTKHPLPSNTQKSFFNFVKFKGFIKTYIYSYIYQINIPNAYQNFDVL